MAKKGKAEFVISAVDRATQTIRNINKQVDSMTAPVRRMRASFGAMFKQAGFGQIGKSFKGVREAVGGVSDAMGGLLRKTGMVAAGMAGVFWTIKKSADGMDSIIKSAQERGVDSGWYQEMIYGAGQAGIEQNLFNNSLRTFQKVSREAADGTGGALGAFRYLKIELRDSNGQMRSTEALFRDAADALAKVEDPALRTRIAMKLFAAEGSKMINMLKDGSAGLDEAAQRARELGKVLDEQALKNAEEFGDALDDMGGAAKGVWNIVAGELIPVLSGLMRELLDWYKANKQLVTTEVTKFAKDLAQGVRDMAHWLKEMLPHLKTTFDWIGGLSGVVKTLAWLFAFSLAANILLTVVAVGKLALAMGGLGLAMGKTGGVGLLGMAKGLMAMKGMAVAALPAMVKLATAAAAAYAAWKAGQAVGGLINKKFVEGTAAGDMIGEGVAKTLALFGNEEAKAAVAANQRAAQVNAGGTITLKINQDGRVRTQQIVSENPDIGLAVDAGYGG